MRLRRAPWLAVGWFWFLGMLVPVIGLVQVGGQEIADRYAYLALVGIGVALVFGVRAAFPAPRARPILLAAGCGAAACLGVRTFFQTHTWRDSRTLYEHALRVTEKNYVAHNNLGLLCQRAGDLPGALEHYQATLAVAPRLADAHSNLGAVFMELGQRERALEHYRTALALRPDFVDAHLLDLIRRRYPDIKLTDVTVRQIKEQHSFVTGYAREAKVKVYVDGRPRVLDFGDMIREACDQLVLPITKGIQDLLKRCDSDSAVAVLENIIVTGGGSQIHGLTRRIEKLLHEDGYDAARCCSPADYKRLVSRGALKIAENVREDQWQFAV